nr:immunoglobulin heavy chain junction region [Mus musculus]
CAREYSNYSMDYW